MDYSIKYAYPMFMIFVSLSEHDILRIFFSYVLFWTCCWKTNLSLNAHFDLVSIYYIFHLVLNVYFKSVCKWFSEVQKYFLGNLRHWVLKVGYCIFIYTFLECFCRLTYSYFVHEDGNLLMLHPAYLFQSLLLHLVRLENFHICDSGSENSPFVVLYLLGKFMITKINMCKMLQNKYFLGINHLVASKQQHCWHLMVNYFLFSL